MRTAIRIVASGFSAFFLCLLFFTTETVAEELGWVSIVRSLVQGGTRAVTEAGYSSSVYAAFLLSLGAAVATWIDYAVRRLFPPKFSEKMETVKGELFRHQRIQIDGKRFVNCTFEGVTLVYKGEATFEFTGNSFDGRMSIELTDPRLAGVTGLYELGQQLGLPLIQSERQ